MLKCEICDKKFESYRKLNGHKSIHREGGRYQKSRRKTPPSYCRQCGKETSRSSYVYCSNVCQQVWQYQNVQLPRILQGKGGNFFRFLCERDGRKCSCCSLETWNDKPIPLDVEHIDGNPINHNPSNLRLMCPNCHRQTETWGMKEGRRKLRAMGQMGRRCLDTAETDGSIPSSPTI